MFLYHRVRAGRIDDVKVAQERNRQIALGQFRRDLGGFLFRSVTKDVNAVGRGQDIYLGELISEKSIQQ